jgi:hypothetical protein
MKSKLYIAHMRFIFIFAFCFLTTVVLYLLDPNVPLNIYLFSLAIILPLIYFGSIVGAYSKNPKKLASLFMLAFHSIVNIFFAIIIILSGLDILIKIFIVFGFLTGSFIFGLFLFKES